MDGRLAAGELHHAAIHGTLAAQRVQHGADLLEVGLVNIAGDVGVGEAHRAGEIAAVGQVNIGQRGMRGVHAAQPAVVRTGLAALDLRIRQSQVVAEVPLLHLEIELDVAEDDVAKLAVLGTAFLHHHFAAIGEDVGRDHLGAFGAERLGLLGKSLLQGLDRRAGVGDFRLQDAQPGPLLERRSRSWRVVGQCRQIDFRRNSLSAHVSAHLWEWSRRDGG